MKMNTYLIGFKYGLPSVAIYDLSEKIIGIILMPLNMLIQAIYPQVSKDKDIKYIWKLMLVLLPISLLVTIVLSFVMESVIVWYAGEKLIDAYYVFRILILLLPISVLNYFIGNLILIPIELIKEYNMSMIIAFAVFLLSYSYIFLCVSNNEPAYYPIPVILANIAMLIYRILILKRERLL
jgi:PST family polysaccharide transporter